MATLACTALSCINRTGRKTTAPLQAAADCQHDPCKYKDRFLVLADPNQIWYCRNQCRQRCPRPKCDQRGWQRNYFFFRSTNAALVCGIYSEVFSVPFAQNDHTTPLTLALTLSAAAAVFKLAMTLPIAPQVAIDFTVMSEIKFFNKLMRRCSMLFRPNSTKQR